MGPPLTPRAPVQYDRRGSAPEGYVGFDPDLPISGWYRMRLRSGGVMVGVRIWFGAPLDPIDGTELDRSHRWQATANGKDIRLDWVWPKCAADPITEAEAAHLQATEEWAKAHAPNSGFADPRRKINLLSEPLPEF